MSEEGRRGPEESSFVERALEGLRSETFTKAVAVGVRSVFASHEGVRKVAEAVPKEVVSFIAEQVDGMRADIFRIFASEIRSFLDRANLGDELRRALTALILQVKMEVRFVPTNDAGGVKPSVNAKVTARRARKKRGATGSKGRGSPQDDDEA